MKFELESSEKRSLPPKSGWFLFASIHYSGSQGSSRPIFYGSPWITSFHQAPQAPAPELPWDTDLMVELDEAKRMFFFGEFVFGSEG